MWALPTPLFGLMGDCFIYLFIYSIYLMSGGTNINTGLLLKGFIIKNVVNYLKID